MKVWWVNYVGQHPQGALIHGAACVESKTDWFPIVSARQKIGSSFGLNNVVIQSWQELNEEQAKQFDDEVKAVT